MPGYSWNFMNDNHQGRKIEMTGEYTVLDCETCGFIHLDPVPSIDVLNDFYSKQYYQSHKASYIQQDDQDRRYLEVAFDERLDILERLTPGRKVLDIGCGAGMFLAYAAKREWECHGIEPSFFAVEIARAKGLDVYHGSYEGFFTANKDSFDVIYLKNVIEHVADPQTLLEVCRSRLTQNGVLFVEAPNDYEWMQKMGVALLKTRNSWISAPDHINYFNFNSLTKLLYRSGLKPVKRTTTFPIYGCLIFGINFIADKQAGAKAHQTRISFELFWERHGLRWLKHSLYAALAWMRTGRTVIYYCLADKKRGTGL
jgi:2-polyprenyl-3-methyl-5-hydroxy-6-metoxy-1,4-benzoquinol methylase